MRITIVVGKFGLHVVQLRVLEKQHRVRIRQRRCQHAPRVGHRRRCQHAQARYVRIPTFETVRMLRRQLSTGACRHPDHQWHGKLPARHMAQQRGGIDNLVECQQAEVDRHDFDDGAHASQRRTDAGTYEAEFGQRGVAYPVGAELLQQTLGHRVSTAVAAYVFAHQKYPRVRQHRFAQRLL